MAFDIAVVTGEPASDYNRSMVLWSERITVALPEDHPLACNEIIYWTDLKRERFLLSERDPGPEIQDILVVSCPPLRMAWIRRSSSLVASSAPTLSNVDSPAALASSHQ